MGKWFPGYRTGTPEQCAAYRQAKQELNRDARHQNAAGVREANEHYERLNHRVWEAARPLHPVQRAWHKERADMQESLDFARLQRVSDRQDRALREGRSR